MEKPISLIINEAKNELTNAVNSLQLHPSILEMVIKDLYNEVAEAARQQSIKEYGEYQKELEAEKDKKEEK